jgi:hypothetical protein
VIPVSFDDVEQIEIVLGPSSALYGPNAHSGVLNIVTSSPLRSQGTKFNFQSGFLNQANTRPLEKYTMRTAHKYKKVGMKVSAVALTGEDWHHFNEDEYEGHSPSFIGRNRLVHNRINDGSISAEYGSPRMPVDWLNNEIPDNGIDDNGNGFIDESLDWGSGSGEDWVGPKIGDGVDNPFFLDAEPGSRKNGLSTPSPIFGPTQSSPDPDPQSKLSSINPFPLSSIPLSGISLLSQSTGILGLPYSALILPSLMRLCTKRFRPIKEGECPSYSSSLKWCQSSPVSATADTFIPTFLYLCAVRIVYFSRGLVFA